MQNSMLLLQTVYELRTVTNRLCDLFEQLIVPAPVRFTPDVTVRDPECVLGDEGPVCGGE